MPEINECQLKKIHTDPVFLTLRGRKGAVICFGCRKQISGQPMPADELQATFTLIEAIREKQLAKKEAAT